MTGMLSAFGVCDCHSHVYGPYDRFPLAVSRAFTPPESPIESLEASWSSLGIDRAVLIQGSACGTDHSGMLDAIGRNPKHRRGVATVAPDVLDEELARLNAAGIRGIRFNWVRHLLHAGAVPQRALIAGAIMLMERVQPLGWHAEVHIDAQELSLIESLAIPRGFLLVIDHMARLDASLGPNQPLLTRLLKLLEREAIWIKISGADRAAASCDALESGAPIVRALVKQAPEKCVWGLDWPHVNLTRKRSDAELIQFLGATIQDEATLHGVLIYNPAKLYRFEAESCIPVSVALDHQGVISQ